MRRMGFALLALASPLSGLVPAAHAADGRLEIHQACVATGCFPGDAPGFPVQITASGSYLLTSDLADANTTAIFAEGDDLHVTIDLNQFTISGPTRCFGSDVPCSPLGDGAGIRQGGLPARIIILNGQISGMGSSGIDLNSLSLGRVEGLTVSRSGANGIKGGKLIRGNVVSGGGGTGIRCDRCVVVENVVGTFGGDGVFALDGAVVRDNLIYLNGGYGIAGGAAVSYGGNQLTQNNGGNDNPQVSFGSVEVGPNFCGDDTACP